MGFSCEHLSQERTKTPSLHSCADTDLTRKLLSYGATIQGSFPNSNSGARTENFQLLLSYFSSISVPAVP